MLALYEYYRNLIFHPYRIDLLLAFQVLHDFIGLFQVFKIALHPMHFANIAILLELFYCLFCMLLFLGNYDNLGWVVL